MEYIHKIWFVVFTMAKLIGLNNTIEAMEDNQELLQSIHVLPQDVQRQIALSNIHKFFLLPKKLAGHDKAVRSIAISGNKIVTASEDTTAKVWDINTGKLLRTFTSHIKPINAVVISGDRVITGSSDGIVYVWDINRSKKILTFIEPNNCILSLAVSGDRLLLGRHSGGAKIWDISADKLRYLFSDQGPVYSVAMSGETVLLGQQCNEAKVYGPLQQTLDGTKGVILSIAISGDKVVTGSCGGAVTVWDIDENKLLHKLETYKGRVSSVVIHGNKVAAALYNADVVKIWDINTGQLLQIIQNNKTRSIAISGNKMITGSEDGTAKIWPLSVDLKAPEFNTKGTALTWINNEITIPQVDLITRIMKVMEEKVFVIKALTEDGKVFLTFPDYVRYHLLDKLKIKLQQ